MMVLVGGGMIDGEENRSRAEHEKRGRGESAGVSGYNSAPYRHSGKTNSIIEGSACQEVEV